MKMATKRKPPVLKHPEPAPLSAIGGRSPKGPPKSEKPDFGPGRTSLDVDALRQVLEMLEGSDVTTLSWRNGDERLLIQRGHHPAPVVMQSPGPAPVSAHVVSMSPPTQPSIAAVPSSPSSSSTERAVAAVAEKKSGHLVSSPFVGTFYRTPAPDQPSFVEVASVVKKGQVLCIVEAMKLMNEIESEVAGRIAEIFVENGHPVEFGQPLFRIEPT
jgi:acetyl-CoA carboxylase biotin carboxyl carrier protein